MNQYGLWIKQLLPFMIKRYSINYDCCKTISLIWKVCIIKAALLPFLSCIFLRSIIQQLQEQMSLHSYLKFWWILVLKANKIYICLKTKSVHLFLFSILSSLSLWGCFRLLQDGDISAEVSPFLAWFPFYWIFISIVLSVENQMSMLCFFSFMLWVFLEFMISWSNLILLQQLHTHNLVQCLFLFQLTSWDYY